MAELRAVTAYARACALPTLGIFTRAEPDDPRPAAALEAARVFAEGAPRSRLQRTAAVDANRAAAEASSVAAKHAAYAAGAAAGAAYLHPLAKATQVRHILGAGAYAARAAEIDQGEDRVVAEYLVAGAVSRATPVVPEVLGRYPRAPQGRSRVAVLMRQIDSLLRDPAPPMRPASDPGPFFHGTRADVGVGEVLTPGWRSNYGSQRPANHIYFTASAVGAPLAAALARGEGAPRVYRVEPLGPYEDDPNVTDKRFPGNPTRSYRTREGLRVVEEVLGWEPAPEAQVAAIRSRMTELAEFGIEALD